MNHLRGVSLERLEDELERVFGAVVVQLVRVVSDVVDVGQCVFICLAAERRNSRQPEERENEISKHLKKIC